VRVAIHQPNYLPRLKVLQKLASADLWVVLDSVQYCAREWQNRAKLVSMHKQAAESWLSLPVHCPEGLKTLIKDVHICDGWDHYNAAKRALLHNFRISKNWDAISTIVEELKSTAEAKALTDICIPATIAMLVAGGCAVPKVIRASSLATSLHASGLMAEICDLVGCTTYLADSGAGNYLDIAVFKKCRVVWQEWNEPEDSWPEIVSWRNISSINFLARAGSSRLKDHLMSGNFVDEPSYRA